MHARCCCLLLSILGTALPLDDAVAEEIPPLLRKWLQPQQWQRKGTEPALSLASDGAFDSEHIFAPCVARVDGRYHLWYCGSQGKVSERVFHLGLAMSEDGWHFKRSSAKPVFAFSDRKHSVLTPTLLRAADGTPLRDAQGRMTIWFSSTHFAGASGSHALHKTTSRDGRSWSNPSPALLSGVYAPSVLKLGERYHLWFTDVSREPWILRHALSSDGETWEVTEQPILGIDQDWEQGRLFYPHVLHIDGVFLMWYGSYWKQQARKTALGFAVSSDGIHWHKHPQNPVLRPEPKRPWESHYTTSHSVIRRADGTFRIWYASRKQPPFVNKYYAIGAARWKGPE